MPYLKFVNTLLATKLRKEISLNCSGLLLNMKLIPVIKEKHYFVENITLDGDAPKEFIRLYRFEANGSIRMTKLKTWIPYIAKTAEKWYPHESVIEYMINRIGQELGLKMNEIELYVINGQVRFLSRFFLGKNESLVHGAEISGEHINDMDMAKQIANQKVTSRQLFTFEFISKAMTSKFGEQAPDLIRQLVKMIIFDGLVGNNDRHFYNWGVITNTKRKSTLPRFAPLYDSARGLLWNSSDDWVVHNLKAMAIGGMKVSHYIDKACPRISTENDNEINHFGLIAYIKNYSADFAVIVEQLSSVDNQERIIEMLKRDFFGFFIPERCILLEHIIKERFKKVREI